MNTTANALLAIGASPVMAHAPEELEEMLRIANALVINIGTLDNGWIHSMETAIDIAKKMNKPVILDPVGAGATKYRTKTALRLLDIGNVNVLRGNFSEIQSLVGEGNTKGVDAAYYDKGIAKEIAVTAAQRFDTTVALTGPVDYVTDGKREYGVENGTPLLAKVTGTGCMVTSIIGAFLAVDEPLRAAVSGLVTFEIAAEMAEKESPYPGTFHMKIYDWLYQIYKEIIEKNARVREIER